MVNTKTEFPGGISDQAISQANSTRGLSDVRSGPGLKLRHGGLTPEASGSKRQASSSKRVKQQATSFKPQATSIKLQAASYKFVDHGPWKKFHGT